MRSPSLQADNASGLLERLAQAADFPEGVAILVDAVLVPANVTRAAVLIERNGELQGASATGWDGERVMQLRVPLTEPSPIADAFRRGTHTVLEGGAQEEALDLLGLGRYAAIPIPRRLPSESPFAVLVADLSGTPPVNVEDLAARVCHAGPLLSRLCEVDELRSVSRQVDRQRELLTSIVNALPDPVLVTDAESNILLENRRAESLLTSLAGDSEGRRRAVEINNLLCSSFLSRFATGGPGAESRELNLVDPFEGTDLLFEVLSTSFPAAEYADGATVSVLREVTDLKRAATELQHQFERVRQAELKSRRERDRLNLVLENVGDPILVTDDQANIILMNREAERLFEVPLDSELHDRRRQDVRANDTKFSSFTSDLALSSDLTRTAEFQLADPETAREFPAEVVSGKIFNDRSEMTAIVSVVHDLTKAVENEQMASELAQLNEGLEDRIRAATVELEERNQRLEWQSRELERAYRLKSEFLASMSHELRTPINALLGYTSLLRDRIYGDLSERQEEALHRMYSASQHLLELVNDVLDLAKIEAGKMPTHLEPVDLELLVREISLTIEPMVRSKNLEYRVLTEPSLPKLETDPTKVKQILLNLLSNAVKFTHSGHVEIRTRRAETGTGVEIVVSDTGIGIGAEDMPKIFEDFRQADQSSTREYGGTGLGLSITKNLLHLLGGTVRVDSSPGEGSTFRVWLPARSEPIESAGEASRAALNADQAVVAMDRQSY
ncbi:hypothetical protein BH23GEM3_BH23GEM3_05050 [soil metagenome]